MAFLAPCVPFFILWENDPVLQQNSVLLENDLVLQDFLKPAIFTMSGPIFQILAGQGHFATFGEVLFRMVKNAVQDDHDAFVAK